MRRPCLGSPLYPFWGILLGTFFFILPWMADAQEGPVVDVRADQVEYFDTQGKVVASGKVEAVYGDVKLTCQQATIYMETKDAYLKGDVRLYQPGALLMGDEILYNFQTKKGTILQAQSQAGAWRSRGDQAYQVSASEYVHRDGYLTSCDFEDPHTRMRAKEARVFLDDKVVMKRVVMYVGNWPVLYLPSYTHPLDDKRPRVTLIPGKDKDWGLFLLTAWRFYLHENLQGRVHVDYRERLDLASGVDLKYKIPNAGDGIIRTYYTHERAIQRDHLWQDDGLATHERERYRMHLRHRWELDTWTLATANYELRKDSTVVKDFFPREHEQDQATSQPSIDIVRSTPLYGLTFLTNIWVNRFEGTSLSQPAVGLNLRPITIPWLPVFNPARTFLTGSQWQYQSDFSLLKGHSTDPHLGTQNSFQAFSTFQELSYATRFAKWLNIHIPFGFRQRSQSRGSTQGAPQFQQAGSTGIDLNTRFYRIFPIQTNFMGLDIHQLRHVIAPSVSWAYQGKPTMASDRLISSSGLVKANSVTLSVEHKLQTKRVSDGSAKNVDLVRFLNTIAYDLEGANGIGGSLGSLGLDFEATPYPWVTMESDASLDPHIGKFTTINADFSFHPGANKWSLDDLEASSSSRKSNLLLAEGLEKQPWSVGMGWRYSRNSSSLLTAQTQFSLGRKWRVQLYQGLDVKRFITETSPQGNRTVKKIYDIPEFEYRLMRDFHEWTAELVYQVKRQQGESILLLFRLKAFPELPFEYGKSYHQPKTGRNSPK